MILRINKTKQLSKIPIEVFDEDRFLNDQKNKSIYIRVLREKPEKDNFEYRTITFEELPKLENNNMTISEIFYILNDDGNIIIDTERTLENAKRERYKKLEVIFKLKWLQIQALAIDKPYMVDKETIQAQIDSYIKLYENALKVLNDPNLASIIGISEEEAKAIVEKHDEADRFTAPINLTMQKVRSLLEDRIENTTDVNDTKVDELLNFASELQLSKENLSLEKLDEILAYFKGE